MFQRTATGRGAFSSGDRHVFLAEWRPRLIIVINFFHCYHVVPIERHLANVVLPSVDHKHLRLFTAFDDLRHASCDWTEEG